MQHFDFLAQWSKNSKHLFYATREKQVASSSSSEKKNHEEEIQGTKAGYTETTSFCLNITDSIHEAGGWFGEDVV